MALGWWPTSHPASSRTSEAGASETWVPERPRFHHPSSSPRHPAAAPSSSTRSPPFRPHRSTSDGSSTSATHPAPSPACSRVPHLRDGFIVAKVGSVECSL